MFSKQVIRIIVSLVFCLTPFSLLSETNRSSNLCLTLAHHLAKGRVHQIWQLSLGRAPSDNELAIIEAAHLIGRGEPGKDGGQAHVGNYTPAHIS